jgi:hypothetical protein
MKTTSLPLFIFVLFSFSWRAQIHISNSKEEIYRWVLVENNDENKILFETKELPTSKDDFTLAVRKLVEQNEISVYFDSVNLNETGEFYSIPEHQYFLDFVNPEKNTAVTRLDYLTYRYQNDIPLLDDYGQPMIRINEFGNQEFIYSDVTLLPLIMSEVAYFKVIQKGKKVNGIPNFENQPLALGFKPKNGVQEIWLSWKEVAANQVLNQFAFVNRILSGEYKGFQYRQFNYGPTIIDNEIKCIYGEIKKTEKSVLFPTNTSISGDLNSEFIEFIVDFVHKELIQVYFGIYSMTPDFTQNDQLLSFMPKNQIPPKIEKDGDLKMLSIKGEILVDDTGEPIRHEGPGAASQYVRSEDEWIYFNKNDISKYWLIQVKSSDDLGFETIAILFFNEDKSKPLFLIDLSDLEKILDKSIVEKWFTYLKGLKLSNEQIFMQTKIKDKSYLR